MCLAPKASFPAVEPPARPPEPPQRVSEKTQAARDSQKRSARAAFGQSGSILTSGQGLTTAARTTGSLLTGS